MDPEYYKEMYLYYQRRCHKLEAFLRSTMGSIEDIVEDRSPSNETPGGLFKDASSRSNSSTHYSEKSDIMLPHSDAVLAEMGPTESIEAGAGYMWLEEFSVPKRDTQNESEENSDENSNSKIEADPRCQAWVAEVCNDKVDKPSKEIPCELFNREIDAGFKIWLDKLCNCDNDESQNN